MRPARFMTALVTAVTLAAQSASAQPAPADRPAARRLPPIVSPEVHPDRTVTFRVRAPNAQKVAVSGEWPGGEKSMIRDEQGLWSVTVGPLEPDLYGYGFSVDGFRTLDPGNPAVKPMRSPTTSILEVAGEKPGPYDFTDVPHGTVRAHAYASKALGKKRQLVVYTPPAYDEKPDEKYPTLYLLHGSGDNEATWTALGRAHLILDNLIAVGKAKPMIVVMTDGHASPAGPPATTPPGGAASGAGIDAFRRDLLEDVMPFVEKTYRVAAEPDRRAIIGLSMGGGQSLTIGLARPDLFHWVGGMSSAVRQPGETLSAALNDADKTNDTYKLIWIACGKDDFLIQANKDFSELLKQKGVRHEFLVSEGNHSWPVWRRYLVQFAPMLFRDGEQK